MYQRLVVVLIALLIVVPDAKERVSWPEEGCTPAPLEGCLSAADLRYFSTAAVWGGIQ